MLSISANLIEQTTWTGDVQHRHIVTKTMTKVESSAMSPPPKPTVLMAKDGIGLPVQITRQIKTAPSPPKTKKQRRLGCRFSLYERTPAKCAVSSS